MAADYIPGYGYMPSDVKKRETTPGQRPDYSTTYYDSGQGRPAQGAPTGSTWREQLIPGYATNIAAPGASSSGVYQTGSNGQFVFNSLNAATTGLVDQQGNVSADIYYYYQPIGQYKPGVPYAGMGPKEERAGQHLGSLATASTIGEALASYWNDPVTRAAVVSASREHYKAYPNWNEQWAEGFFKDIVNVAAATGLNPGTIIDRVLAGEMSLDDATSTASSGGGSYGYGSGSYGGGGGGGGGQVSLTNPTSARGLLMQTMQSVLGRNPTESEYSTFLKSLNEAQMENPVTVDTSGDNLVQSGGVDPNVLALEFAQGAEDYKSREASKYYNMFMAALGGASGG